MITSKWMFFLFLYDLYLISSQSILPTNTSNSTHYYFIASSADNNFTNISITCPTSTYCNIFCDNNHCERLTINAQESTHLDLNCYGTSCYYLELNTSNDNTSTINVLCEYRSCNSATFLVNNIYGATFTFDSNTASKVSIYGEEIIHSFNILCIGDSSCYWGPKIYTVDPYVNYNVAINSNINITLLCGYGSCGYGIDITMNQTKSFDILYQLNKLILNCKTGDCGMTFICKSAGLHSSDIIMTQDGSIQCDTSRINNRCCPISFMNDYVINNTCDIDINGDCIIYCDQVNKTYGCSSMIINATNVISRYFKVFCTINSNGAACDGTKILLPIHNNSYSEIQCIGNIACSTTEISYVSETLNPSITLYCIDESDTYFSSVCWATLIDFSNTINVNYYMQSRRQLSWTPWYNGVKLTHAMNTSHGSVSINCLGERSCGGLMDFGYINDVTVRCSANSGACSSVFIHANYANNIHIYCGVDDCSSFRLYALHAKMVTIEAKASSALYNGYFYVHYAQEVSLYCAGFVACSSSHIYAQNASTLMISSSSSHASISNVNVYPNAYKTSGINVVSSTSSAIRGLDIYVPDDYVLGYLTFDCSTWYDCVGYDSDFSINCMGERETSYIIRKGTSSNYFYSCIEYPWDPTKCCPWNQTTKTPTLSPTIFPTVTTISPTRTPTFTTNAPSVNPSRNPTNIPSIYPSIPPTTEPTSDPSEFPTRIPTLIPTQQPTTPSQTPTTAETTEVNGGIDGSTDSVERINPFIMIWCSIMFVIYKYIVNEC